jgi:uncharacterized protein (DUF58 family)
LRWPRFEHSLPPVHPSRKTLVLIAIGLGLGVLPVLVDRQLWVIWIGAWGLFLLALLIDLLGLARLADLRLRLTLPDTLYMGETSDLALHLAWTEVTSARPVKAELKLDLSPTLAPAPAQRALLSDQETHLTIPLRPLRRGTAQIECAWLRWSAPLGLLQRTASVPLARDIDATPNLRAVRQLAARFASRELRSGLRIERYMGDGTEFDSLREFMPGFDRRSIDWKSSARHTKLLSRDYRAERDRQVVLCVDTGHLMAEPLDGLPRLDHAIHSALLLAFFSARAGDRVGLFAFDERPGAFSAPRAGTAAFRTLLKVSAGLRYSDSETNFTFGLTDLLQRLTRRSLVVVMTDFVDSVTAELMVDNLSRLAARHLVVFVSLRDPLLGRVVDAFPADLVTLQRSVVADSMLREREVVLGRLRRKGILCIDASPGEVGMQLLNRYLEIKRREMI